jgi:hypothetical protein
MSILEHFPLISQQTNISWDGHNPNATMNCVPTSILAGLMYLHGVTALDAAEWNTDHLLDMAYPEGYQGGTMASKFVEACASFGDVLAPLSGNPGTLIEAAHRAIQAGHPVVFTEPDPYVPSSWGWTHVCVWYSEQPGQLTALDPWPGRPIIKSDAEWMQLVQFNQIWTLSKKEEEEDMPQSISLSSPLVGDYFTGSETQWTCRQTGKTIQGAILAYYTTGGRAGELCGLTELGLPKGNAIPLPDVAGGLYQNFERGVLVLDPSHKNDNPPGSGAVYHAHLYQGVGVDPLVAPLEAEVAALKAGVDPALQAKIAAALKDLS